MAENAGYIEKCPPPLETAVFFGIWMDGSLVVGTHVDSYSMQLNGQKAAVVLGFDLAAQPHTMIRGPL